MSHEDRHLDAVHRLRAAGLRPTRQRLGLAHLLFAKGDRHISAEQLHREAQKSGLSVSLATVYNSLNQFRHAGLLREVVVEPGRSFFDTNMSDHHHFFSEADGQLTDIPADRLQVTNLPAAPDGTRISRVDVIVRVQPESAKK